MRNTIIQQNILGILNPLLRNLVYLKRTDELPDIRRLHFTAYDVDPDLSTDQPL